MVYNNNNRREFRSHTEFRHGVPQGSVLRSMLFTSYRIEYVNIHCYADDSQLFFSKKLDETNQEVLIDYVKA